MRFLEPSHCPSKPGDIDHDNCADTCAFLARSADGVLINVRNCGEKRGDIDYTNGLYGDADRQGPFPAYHIN